MAGWLDDLLNGAAAGQPLPGGLLAMLGQIGPSAGFPPNVTPEEEMRAAEEARTAAAGRMGRATKRPTPFDVGTAPGPDLYDQMAPTAPDALPPPAGLATQAPTSAPSLPEQYGIPPQFQGGVPYFPPGAQGSDIPPPPVPSRGDIAPAAAPLAAPVASPDILGTIGRHILQGLRDNSNSLIAGGGAMISGGLGHGLSAMAQAAPLDIAARRERQGNEAIAATYQAVLQQQLSRGLPPAEARANALAASQNPEILKTFMGPQFQKAEIKGIAGDTQPVSFDPRTGRYFDANGKPVAGAAAGVSGPDTPQGQEYLDKYVPKNLHPIVRAAANYDVPISGMGALKQLQPHILAYDPSYDATNYAAKVALKKNYLGGGKNYEELKSFERLGNHLNTLKQAVENLDPSQIVGLNSLRNMFSDYGVNNPKVIALRNALNTVNHELGNAYHAGHITDSTLHAFQQNLNDTMSVPGFKSGIGTMGELIHGIINTNENAFNNALPGDKGPKEFRALSEGTRQKFQKINEWALGVGGDKGETKTVTKAEYDALPKGATYTAPDGSQRTKR